MKVFRIKFCAFRISKEKLETRSRNLESEETVIYFDHSINIKIRNKHQELKNKVTNLTFVCKLHTEF